jgi:hypothetical protein
MRIIGKNAMRNSVRFFVASDDALSINLIKFVLYGFYLYQG